MAGWRGDGFKCEDIDECKEGTAQCQHTCSNTPGGYECSCRDGFQLVGPLLSHQGLMFPAFGCLSGIYHNCLAIPLLHSRGQHRMPVHFANSAASSRTGEIAAYKARLIMFCKVLSTGIAGAAGRTQLHRHLPAHQPVQGEQGRVRVRLRHR